MPFVETPGLRIHYLQEGGGDEPVVFLHGFPQTSYQWRHQMAALAAAGYACFAPDNRGFGRTDKPDVRISRGLLARDVASFMDAVGLESAHLVTHDWGGIIGFKVVADHPGRVRSIALLDTLCTVWHPRAQHGYWFKAEGLAEEFFARYHSTWIEVTFAGRDGADLPGVRAAPWGFPPGARARPTWISDDALDHYRTAFSDPASWAAAIQYYRYGLPFHVIDAEDRPHLLSECQVAEMWLHPDGLTAHPLHREFMDYGPEDRATRFPRPALWLYGRYLGRPSEPKEPTRASEGSAASAAPPPARGKGSGNPFVDQFGRYFPDLRSQPVEAGHFLAEEAADVVTASLLEFLPRPRS
jgi:pimeloyl-ACP methyl ester carboxylesterase